jgi:hypothetical protein
MIYQNNEKRGLKHNETMTIQQYEKISNRRFYTNLNIQMNISMEGNSAVSKARQINNIEDLIQTSTNVSNRESFKRRGFLDSIRFDNTSQMGGADESTHDKKISWLDDKKLDAINQLIDLSPKTLQPLSVGRSFDFKNSPMNRLQLGKIYNNTNKETIINYKNHSKQSNQRNNL